MAGGRNPGTPFQGSEPVCFNEGFGFQKGYRVLTPELHVKDAWNGSWKIGRFHLARGQIRGFIDA